MLEISGAWFFRKICNIANATPNTQNVEPYQVLLKDDSFFNFLKWKTLLKKCPYSELFRIFLHSDWIRTGITPNTDTFYVVKMLVQKSHVIIFIKSHHCLTNYVSQMNQRDGFFYFGLQIDVHVKRSFQMPLTCGYVLICQD